MSDIRRLITQQENVYSRVAEGEVPSAADQQHPK